jgi:hypothetical protein
VQRSLKDLCVLSREWNIPFPWRSDLHALSEKVLEIDREPYFEDADTLAWLDKQDSDVHPDARATVPEPPDDSLKDNTWEMQKEMDCMEAAAASSKKPKLVAPACPSRFPHWRQASTSRDEWKCSCCRRSASVEC